MMVLRYLDGPEKVIASHLRHAVVSEHDVNGWLLQNNSEKPISEFVQFISALAVKDLSSCVRMLVHLSEHVLEQGNCTTTRF